MEFEQVHEKITGLRDTFNEYLNYKGLNLWDLCEHVIKYNFVEAKKTKIVDDLKNTLFRQSVKINDFLKERKKFDTPEKEVIMLVYSPIHVVTFQPIIKKLTKVKVVNYDSAFSQVTKKFLEENNIPYVNFDSYANKNLKKNLKKAERWLNLQWVKIKKDEKLKIKLGEDYGLILNILKYYMKTRKKFLEVIRFIEILNNLYDTEKNKLILLAEDANPLGKTAVTLAEKRGVQSLTIQHGTIGGKDSRLYEVRSDKVAVGGQIDKRYLTSLGDYSKKIEIVGQSKFDEMVNELKKTKQQACKEMNLNPDKKIIIFAAQSTLPGDNTIPNAIIEFLETVKKIKNKSDFEFIIKLHPHGDEKYIPKINEKLGIKIVKKINLYPLLTCCDILITTGSMVGVESVLLNRPVISVEIGGRFTITDYEKDGVGVNVNEKGDLKRAIDKVLYDSDFKKKFSKSRERFIKDFAYKLDGKASDRIVNLINEMTKKKKI